MKVAEDAAQELPLNDERLPKKNRHVVIALNHLSKRKEFLSMKRDQLDKEIEDLDEAIQALG